MSEEVSLEVDELRSHNNSISLPFRKKKEGKEEKEVEK